MPWQQLSLTADEDKSPLVELLFENLGALSVTYGDAGDEPMLEPALGTTPLWKQTCVTALFEEDANLTELTTQINQALSENIAKTLTIEHLQDQVWERAWLDGFKPMHFGQHLWICPDGQKPEDPDAIIVELDPGLAFGTGTHATTALCLNWLGNQDLTGMTLIDYGCGSGILSIAALCMGAEHVIAIDHDPQALEATLDNAKKNQVEKHLQICTTDKVPDIQADVLVANILASTLIELQPRLKKLVKVSGTIILSGILHDQAEEVALAYRDQFSVQAPIVRDDWVMLEGTRSP